MKKLKLLIALIIVFLGCGMKSYVLCADKETHVLLFNDRAQTSCEIDPITILHPIVINNNKAYLLNLCVSKILYLDNKYMVYYDENGSLYKCNLDGTNKIKISGNCSFQYTFYGKDYSASLPYQTMYKGWLYFIDKSGFIYRANIGVAGKTFQVKSLGVKAKELKVTSGFIYYISQDNCIQKMTPEGKNSTKVLYYKAAHILLEADNRIIYIGEDSYLYSIKTDGSQKKLISKYPILNQDEYNVFYYNGMIYYLSSGKSVYETNIDGSINKKIIDAANPIESRLIKNIELTGISNDYINLSTVFDYEDYADGNHPYMVFKSKFTTVNFNGKIINNSDVQDLMYYYVNNFLYYFDGGCYYKESISNPKDCKEINILGS